jgi:hypothetical protein
MRIALLPSAFRPRIGGVETVTDSFARNLVSAGHHVEVWTSRSPADGLPENELIDGSVGSSSRPRERASARRYGRSAPYARLRA